MCVPKRRLISAANKVGSDSLLKFYIMSFIIEMAGVRT